jgi:hypothetical protein
MWLVWDVLITFGVMFLVAAIWCAWEVWRAPTEPPDYP